VNNVIVSLRTDKGMPPKVITEGAAEMPGEMIAAGVIGAAGKSAIVSAAVKTYILAADSSHEVAPNFVLGGRHTVDGVDIIEDRPIGNNPEEHAAVRNAVRRLSNAGRDRPAKAEVMLQDNVAAEAHVQAATF